METVNGESIATCGVHPIFIAESAGVLALNSCTAAKLLKLVRWQSFQGGGERYGVASTIAIIDTITDRISLDFFRCH